jgi:acyl carrier protein
MTPEDIRLVVLAELGRIAPEADLAQLDPDADLREAVDIDSVDFLGFLVAVNERLGVSIPEADYRRITTLRSCTDYLDRKLHTT